MPARRSFWKIDIEPFLGPDGTERLRLLRTRRKWFPRAVVSARRLVRPGLSLNRRLRVPIRVRPTTPVAPLRPAPQIRRFAERLKADPLAARLRPPARRARPRRETRQVLIVTTAAPPWLTGTAVNPLCRAIAFAHRGLQTTILFPWLAPANQGELFSPGLRFATPDAQERWIRQHFACDGVEICFYEAKYLPALKSILPLRSIASSLPPSDLLILEEPEHLLAPHPWQQVKERSRHVVGVVHTHYLYFMEQHFGHRLMAVAAPPIRATLPKVVYRNCHQTICLSRIITGYTGAIFENINGVRDEFFPLPGEVMPPLPEGGTPHYFMGKLIWEKGFRELVDLLADSAPQYRTVTIYGAGEAQGEITEYARARGVTLLLKGVSLKPYHDLRPYRVFVNPSTSEVLCTTTAEALAMGKFAIIPRHLSNEFFYRFRNCLVYDSPEQFRKHLAYAFAHEPHCSEPGTLEDIDRNTDTDALTWDAATERLLHLLRRPAALRAGFGAGVGMEAATIAAPEVGATR